MFAPGGITTTIRSILISIIGLVILVPKPIELILILLWNGSTTWFVMNPATRALVVIFMTARALITVISEVEAATERCSNRETDSDRFLSTSIFEDHSGHGGYTACIKLLANSKILKTHAVLRQLHP
ncbi:hypothetical protein HBI13_207750 [Parastagonospora nodorum]|nr:hypothetical protein HBI10_215790 [Parastagonospora nodorum]KAH4010422.1 hypothetical protein HBI13_207750 [Parastagonospora nodorum]KAH4156376.1 hypothetical protein HBH43_207020 [Parastagonospora nodorum]KAH4798962.1 hypothetical protein HBH61_235370 [Parastagonospora nodorum]KAH5014843.1 hypothetical protein HBI75_188790 [Parastagonospora nodorum]